MAQTHNPIATRPGAAVQPVLDADPRTSFELGGELGRRVSTTINAWVIPAPQANPDMLEMFRRRERRPYQVVAPWAGEYAGKYLTHAAQLYGLTRDRALRDHLEWFVRELVSVQAPDGYFGPFPTETRLRSGGGPQVDLIPPEWVWPTPWDSWGQYHVMLGLLEWHRWANDDAALAAARRCADFFAGRFPDQGERLSTLGAVEMNQAPVHAFALLYRLAGDERYRALAEWVVDDFATPGAGDYLEAGLAGTPFHATPKPRWESLHPIQALAELFLATGEARYREAFESLWWSIAEHERHTTGGFGSDERASGDPYGAGPQETCCTVAWLAMTVDMLRLTGISLIADELELATLNGGMGALSRSGRWVTYDTPMDGERRAFVVDNGWQARVGAPELSCCGTNGPRVLGLVAEWGVMVGADGGVAVNWYGPGRIRVPLPTGGELTLDQRTDYPRAGRVAISVGLAGRRRLAIDLRIPQWSEATRVTVAGESVEAGEPGRYLRIEREWQDGDVIELELDLRLRAWVRPGNGTGDGSETTLASIYRGPLLLAYDPRHDREDRTADVRFEAPGLRATPRDPDGWLPPWLLVDVADPSGASFPLVDFASAGEGGDRYRSWLPVAGLEPVAATRRRPIPTVIAE